MLPVLVFIALVVVVGLLAHQKRVRLRSCCGSRPWPPDDLTGS